MALLWLSLGAALPLLMASADPSATVSGAAEAASRTQAAVDSKDPSRLAQAARWFAAWKSRERDSRTARAAIRLANACRIARACDSYYALRYARAAADLSDAATRSALAREFLGIDLPGYAVEALRDRRAGPLGRADEALYRSAYAAARINVEDSTGAMDRPVADEARRRVADRLWLLLGVPALDETGAYLDEGFRFAPRTSTMSEADFVSNYRMSSLEWRRAHSVRPSLAALFSRSYRPELERLYEFEGPWQPTGVAVPLAPAALAQLVARVEGASGDQARAALVALLADVKRRTDVAEPQAVPPDETFAVASPDETAPAAVAATLQLSGASARDGAWLLSLTVDPWLADEQFAIVRRSGGLVAYPLGEARTAWFDEVDGRPGAEIVLTSSEGSGSFFDLSIFSPATATGASLASQLYRGQFSFADLDGDPAKEVVVSQALSLDERYSSCNQCPKRRSAYIVDFDESSGRFRIAGASLTGTEDSANASGNLFGISASMRASASAEGAGQSLRRLVEAGAAAPTAEDVETVLGQAQMLSEADQYPAAIQLAGRVAQRLEPLRGAQFGPHYLQAHLIAGFAEVHSGNPLATIARLRRVAPALAGLPRDAQQSYWSLMAVAAMALGDSAIAHEAMQREQAVAAPDRRSPGQGNLAMLFSHFGAWRAAGAQTLTAMDMSLREQNYKGMALMMINAAEAERRNGDLPSALDWLARAMRLSRSFSDSGDTAYAFQVAVAIALDAQLPDVAIALLDISLPAHTSALWRIRGPDHLLLYGRALEQKGDVGAAARAFTAAARLAEQRAGLRSVEAWAEVGRLALSQSDEAGARDAYRRAFNRIAQGRRSTPTDAYKISYLQNVDAVAEQHFALSSGRSDQAIFQQAADLEAWKFQVFRDRYSPDSALDSEVVRTLQARLRPNEAYISYFVSPSVSFALVVTHDSIRRRDLELDASGARALRSEILDYMDLGKAKSAAYIRQRRMPPGLSDALQRARESLIAPLALPENVDTVLINEDEDLAGLPWAAVPPSPEGWIDWIKGLLGFPRVRSFLERYHVAVVPSAQLIIRPPAKAVRDKVVIAGALGPVDAATVSRALGVASREETYASLPPLTRGVNEIEAVNRAFGGSAELLLDRYGSSKLAHPSAPLGRDSLRRALGESSVWHFVGHGVFNRLDPMGSAIFLGEGSPGEWVNGSDLAAWDLKRISLVALSACETGTTRPEVGGETFGMLRGLLAGGVRSAMVMAWPVDDLASSRFYGNFYERFGAETTGEAHRRAALKVKDEFVHPFYWAAPTLYGDWR